jgi:hypothetical protein
MRLPLYICGVVGSALLLAEAAVAKMTVLQIVDLTELGMSTEGGEATLYRDNDTLDCRIEAIHYGETGRSILVFAFGSKLISAEATEYRYKTPLNVDPKAKLILAKKTNLESRAGRETLPTQFETYKSLFDAGNLAKCSGS